MSAWYRVAEQEMSDTIAQGRQIRPAPDVVRARLLARARAAVVAEAGRPAGVCLPTSTDRGRLWSAAVAGALLAVTAASTAATLYARATSTAPREVPADRNSAKVSTRALDSRADVDIPIPPIALVSGPRHSHRPISPQESYAAELKLLERAQSYYVSRDLLGALVLVSEHASRFPRGRLAEEREALRVSILSEADRADEARRALGAFARRFPHSPFLPRLQDAARDAED